MISNQILQSTIEGLKGITRIDICIMDTEGKPLASTINDAEESEEAVLTFVDSPADSQVLQGYQFFKVFDENQLEYKLNQLLRNDKYKGQLGLTDFGDIETITFTLYETK